MPSIELLRNEFMTILKDSNGPLVRQIRSDVPIPSIAALDKLVDDAARVYDESGRAGWVLLVDMRAITGRNDEQFEARMRVLRSRRYGGFLRVGILLRSSVGALQVKRMVREDGIARMAMTDEESLIEYLLHS